MTTTDTAPNPPAQDVQYPARTTDQCPNCKQKGRPVEGQTVKSMLAVSLRAVRDVDSLFCRTRDCPVVYFTADGTQTFTTGDVRERVYQKEPDSDDVLVCYCFGHTLGEIRAATGEFALAIVENINAGIKAGQCACDLRNPQGSCCLGNVRALKR